MSQAQSSHEPLLALGGGGPRVREGDTSATTQSTTYDDGVSILSAVSGQKEAQQEPQQSGGKYLRVSDKVGFRSKVSIHSLSSASSAIKEPCGSLGCPQKRKSYSVLDLAAVLTSIGCFIVSVIIVLPNLTVAWHMGFQSQIIAIGFLLSLMNICANKVIVPCLVAIEAQYGGSRLQNFEAIITNKFLGSHVALLWRATIIFLLALPLSLSIGYKQFIGGTSSAFVTPETSAEYGISFPNIGDWAPIQDPAYLEFSADAAFHSASSNDTTELSQSVHYPAAFGMNVLLLSEDSSALLDLPMNTYLQEIRSQLETGETWQMSASVYAFLAVREDQMAATLRNDDAYWTTVLNESDVGLTSYFLSQDLNTYMGLLAVVGQPFCWLGLFQGGPTSFSMYSKTINEPNVYGFRQSAHLFSLSRTRCEATWKVSASSISLQSGVCANKSTAGISQEPVLGCKTCPWSINGGPRLAHIFADFVTERQNSTWLIPRYAVTAATTYWARGVYIIQVNKFQGFNYTAMGESIKSTRDTLSAAPLLFVCLAVQPVITILAFFLIIWFSLPISDKFGLVTVLSGIQQSSLELLQGASFSGKLQQPVMLAISVSDSMQEELSSTPVAFISYELKREAKERNTLTKADKETLYL